MIEARVSLTHPEGTQRQFVARTGGGHHLLIDDKEGASGPKPIELVAAGLAGCTAFDVINILRKKRQRITSYEVQVEAEQAAEPPAVFTRVRIRHLVTGVRVDEQAVADAIRLSEEKYCSVGAMVRRSAQMETSWEIFEDKRIEAAEAVLAG